MIRYESFQITRMITLLTSLLVSSTSAPADNRIVAICDALWYNPSLRRFLTYNRGVSPEESRQDTEAPFTRRILRASSTLLLLTSPEDYKYE